MTILKFWFSATATLLAVWFLYHFAPIVLFLLVMTALVGGISFVFVSIAHVVAQFIALRKRNRS